MSKPAVSLPPASPLSPLLSFSPQYLANLHLDIILALSGRSTIPLLFIPLLVCLFFSTTAFSLFIGPDRFLHQPRMIFFIDSSFLFYFQALRW
jgi:hypothetical protein